MGCFTARGIPNIYVSLIFNSVLLCCCYLLYTLDWMRHTTTCGQSGIIVSYVTASSSIFYATMAIATTAAFCLYLISSGQNLRFFCIVAIMISFISLLYVVVAAVIMFISLHMKFNPACFKNRNGKADVAYMSVLCGYNLISYFVFSFVTILLLDSTSTIGTSGTTNLSGDSPRSCDKKVRSTTSSSIATIS